MIQIKTIKIMKTKLFFASLIMTLFFSVQMNAQNAPVRTPNERINQGVKNGEITKAEHKNLKADQRQIRQDKRAAAADGVVTKSEKRQIKGEKKDLNKKIYRKKHNNKTAPAVK